MPMADFEGHVETTLEAIQKSDVIHPANKADIAEFKRDLALDDMSAGWLQKLTSHLKIMAEHLEDTSFRGMDEEHVKDLVEWVHNREKSNGETISPAIVNAYKQIIKRFWRWMDDLPRGEHPEPLAWINTTGQSASDAMPKDLLTRDDIDALKDACRNPATER